MLNWFKNRRRRRIAQTPWPTSWDSILTNKVGHFKGLSLIEKSKLKTIIKIIVSEKNWEAHDGLVMSDEIKITIAGTAALLLLGVDGFYFDHVNTIIVFPHPIRRETQDGLIVGRESRHAGEAWQGGQVVLSWQDVVSDSRTPLTGETWSSTNSHIASMVSTAKWEAACHSMIPPLPCGGNTYALLSSKL